MKRILQIYFYSKIKFGAEGRNRTGMGDKARRILSPLRLPISPPRQHFFGGDTRNRTGDEGFADPRLTTWLCRLLVYFNYIENIFASIIAVFNESNEIINFF